MQIHDLKVKKAKGNKRIGRGGKKGTYSGRGGKGQTARSGFSSRATFEGGMSTLVARTKKLRGFKSNNDKNQVVNLRDIEMKFEAGQEVTVKTLKEKDLIRYANKPVKILSVGELSKQLTFKGLQFSKITKDKIEKVGGTVA